VIAGLERFGIEILRAKDDRLLGPFTLAQLTSVLLVTVGIAILQSWRAQPSVAPGAYLAGNAAAGTRAVSAAAGGAAS
jgi:phosphatidylglycerol:prolipoprotein diacylglycerol transferase